MSATAWIRLLQLIIILLVFFMLWLVTLPDPDPNGDAYGIHINPQNGSACFSCTREQYQRIDRAVDNALKGR